MKESGVRLVRARTLCRPFCGLPAIMLLATMVFAGLTFYSRSAARYEISRKTLPQTGPKVSLQRVPQIGQAPIHVDSHVTTLSSPIRASVLGGAETLSQGPSRLPSKAATRPAAAGNVSLTRNRAVAKYADLPLRFEANRGQSDPRVKFLSHGQGYSLFLTQKEAVLSVIVPEKNAQQAQIAKANSATRAPRQAAALRVKFSGATGTATVTGKDLLRSQTNYFLGNDPKLWHTGVPNYAAVEYHGLYAGIDAVFHGSHQQFEFDFDVAPGADLSKVELEIEGSAKPRVNAQGNIVLSVADQTEVMLDKPNVYQEIAGRRHEVAGNFVVRSGNRIGFSVGDYDRSLPLVIDPTFTFTYSTYIGGNLADSVSGVAEDSTGTYLVGTTDSTTFPDFTGTTTPVFPYPNPGAYQTTCDSCAPNAFNSAFVAKFDVDQTLVYYTYLGPAGNPDSEAIGSASGSAIAVDLSGDAYVTGQTNSGYFPYGFPPNAMSPLPYPGGPFVSELSSDGATLLNSTSIGGSTKDQGNGIALDNQGNVYVVGTTTSQGLATTGAVQTSFTGSYQAPFLAEISPSNWSTPSYYTYLLGSCCDIGSAIAVDQATGDVFVGGTTLNIIPPVGANTITGQGTYRPNSSFEYAGFVAELNPTTSPSSLRYFSYLYGPDTHNPPGGARVINGTEIMAVALDGADNVYATGTTDEPRLPTTNNVVGGASSTPTSVCQPSTFSTTTFNLCPRGFVAEFNPNVSGTQSLAAVSYFGGITPTPPVNSVATQGNGIAVDQGGDIFVTGSVTTSDFPESDQTPTSAGAAQTYQPYQPLQGTLPCTTPCQSGFLVEFSPGATNIWYSTYLGSGNDTGTAYATGIALDSKSNVYLAGNESGSTATIPQLSGTPPLIANPPSSRSGFFSVLAFPTDAPAISFSPPAANLSSTNTSTPLTVTNTSSAILEIQNFYVTVTTPGAPSTTFNAVFGGSTPACTGSSTSYSIMYPDNACTFTASFNPPAVAGQYSGTITFIDNAPQGTPDPNYIGYYDQTYVLEGTSTGSGAMLVSIAVTPPSPSITKGTTQQFTATGTYSDTSTANVTTSVTWASATPSVATISNAPGTQGLATGVGAGTSQITATLGSVISPPDTMTVTAATLQSITVTPLSPSIGKGHTQQFTATGTYSDTSTADITASVTWASATQSVATIGASTGLATGVGTGTSQITATLGSVVSSSDTLTVTAATLQSIAVTPSNPSIAKGLTVPFTATGTYSDTTTANITTSVTWASATQSVATIGASTGLATGVGVGASQITATLGSVVSPPATLTVTAAALQSISVTPPSPSILIGATQQFIATGTYSDTTTANITTSVTWASDTQSVATIVASTGLATGVGAGTSQITATLGSVVSPPATLTVAPPPPPPAYANYNVSTINLGNAASGGTATRELLVYNSAQGSWFTITSATAITLSGTGSPFSFTGVSNCNGVTSLPVTLAYLQTCQLNLQYAPTATESDIGQLQIVDDAAQSNLQNVSTTGTQRNIALYGNAVAILGTGQLTTIAGNTDPPGGTCSEWTGMYSFVNDPQCAQQPGGETTGPPCLAATGPVPLCDGGYSGDGGPATVAKLNSPEAVAVTPDGTVYIADTANTRIRAVDPISGDISSINWTTSGCQENQGLPGAMAADGLGNVYFGDSCGNIWEIVAGTGTASVLTNFSGGRIVQSLATDSNNNLYALVSPNIFPEAPEIFEFCSSGNTICNGSGGGSRIVASPGVELSGLAADLSGNIYSYDVAGNSHSIVEVSSSGITPVSQPGLVSGGGIYGSSLALDSAGNFYIINGALLQEYTPTGLNTNAQGTLTILAGTGVNGYNNGNNPNGPYNIISNYDNDGPFPAGQTDLNQAAGIAVDQFGAIYIADTANNLVRKVVNTAASNPAGTPESVTPIDSTTLTSPITITFSSGVTTGGQTTLTESPTGPTGTAPTGYQFDPNNPPIFLYISTSATPTPPVSIQICLNLGLLNVIYPPIPSLVHYVNGVASTPYTLTLNPMTGEYCASGIPSLSPFVLVKSTAPFTPQVNWTAPAAITYGTALSTTQLNATVSPSIPGSFVYSPPAGTVLGGGQQPLAVTFTPQDTTDYTSATGGVMLTVNPAGTTVQLSTSANGSIADGTPVVLTAKVVSATTGTPTLTVTFLNSNGSNSTTLGTATLSQGIATLTVSTLPSGSNNVTAQYSGDTNFTTSTSPVETVTVNSPDYTVSANPSTLTVAAGQSATTTITVTPQGYSGTVSFSCGSLPAYITCAFNPSSGSLTFASGATAAQTITLTVSVASTISRLELQRPFLLAMAIPLGLLGLLPITGGKRKRLRFYLGIVLLAITAAGVVAGCSSSGGSSPTSSLPPAGNQSFTVSASGSSSSGTISHQLPLTIDITN